MLRLGGAYAMDRRLGGGDGKRRACRTAVAFIRAGSAGRAGALGSDACRRQASAPRGPAADGGRAGEAARDRLSTLRTLPAKTVHERLPAPVVSLGVRQVPIRVT